jgi:hypothetical protein
MGFAFSVMCTAISMRHAACLVAQSRLFELHYKYPHLLPLDAFQHSFDSLPADVRQVSTKQLRAGGS